MIITMSKKWACCKRIIYIVRSVTLFKSWGKSNSGSFINLDCVKHAVLDEKINDVSIERNFGKWIIDYRSNTQSGPLGGGMRRVRSHLPTGPKGLFFVVAQRLI